MNGMAVSKGVVVGMILVMIGFCFKISAVPFHMWAPDVYEGAPTPVTAFFATAPKIAAMALFMRLMLQPFGDLLHQWQQVVIFMSIASMLVGALAAIQQTNIKRLLAYSSIGHVGFMLMALAAGSQAGVQAMLIYLAVYIFMSAGAFGCVLLMRRGGHYVEDIKDLSGLSKTRPIMAFAMAAFMFAMAGIPPLSGFFGKMYVVLAAIGVGLTWLAVIGVATSVIGGYYYIRVVKVMYFDEPAKAFDKQVPFMLAASTAICLAVTLFFFFTPTPVILEMRAAAEALLK
jgi:NADH-quinone oxidoreductase subunit N